MSSFSKSTVETIAFSNNLYLPSVTVLLTEPEMIYSYIEYPYKPHGTVGAGVQAFTTAFPTFSPWSNPMNAFIMLSNPSVTVS
jgi:hypothetical protein